MGDVDILVKLNDSLATGFFRTVTRLHLLLRAGIPVRSGLLEYLELVGINDVAKLAGNHRRGSVALLSELRHARTAPHAVAALLQQAMVSQFARKRFIAGEPVRT
jgi:hypothetical protein